MAKTLTYSDQKIVEVAMSGVSGAYLEVWAKLNSQNTNSNKSSVTAWVNIRNVQYTAFHCYTHSCNFNGGTFNASDYKGSYYHGWESDTSTTILSQTLDITHNEDGNKSFSLGAYFTCSAGVSGTTANETVNIPKINRVSPITGFSGSDVEGNISATYTQYVSSYSQKLRIAINGGATLQTFDDYTSGANVTLNASSVSAIQDFMNTNSTKQITLAAVIETWNGTTKVGESNALTNVFTFSDANPDISNIETETDANVITYYGTTASTVVQSVSKVQCEITATAKKGATIYNVSIVHNGVTYPTTLSSGKYVATIPITANSFVINVTDNRGNASSKTVTKTMVTYSPVDFTAFTIKRVNSTSSNIRFDIEARYYQVSLIGTANAPVIKYKKDDGNYVTIPSTEYTIDSTNHKVTITNYVAQNELVYTSAGQFTLYIEDKLTNDTDGGTRAYVTKGIATFEAGEHDLKVNGIIYQADQDGQNKKEMWELVYPVGSIYISTSSTFDPNTSFGGTWQKIEDRVLLGSGTKYTLGATGGNADGIGGLFGIAGANYGGMQGGQGEGNYNGRIAVVDGSLQISQSSMQYFNSVQGMDFMPPYKVVNIWERTA